MTDLSPTAAAARSAAPAGGRRAAAARSCCSATCGGVTNQPFVVFLSHTCDERFRLVGHPIRSGCSPVAPRPSPLAHAAPAALPVRPESPRAAAPTARSLRARCALRAAPRCPRHTHCSAAHCSLPRCFARHRTPPPPPARTPPFPCDSTAFVAKDTTFALCVRMLSWLKTPPFPCGSAAFAG